jgi:ATP-dependent RNA helicase DeaD
MKFEELNIDERILRAIEDMGFEETSPIQTQAIPAVCEGIDVVGQAQTGTGKTAAYTIPMLMKIDPQIATGDCIMSYKRACSTGCRRDSKACQIYE